MFKKFRKNLLQLVLIIFFLYFFVLVFLYFYQRNLLYHPNENNYSGDKISVDIKKVKKLPLDWNNFGIYWRILGKEKKCSKNLGKIYCN